MPAPIRAGEAASIFLAVGRCFGDGGRTMAMSGTSPRPARCACDDRRRSRPMRWPRWRPRWCRSRNSRSRKVDLKVGYTVGYGTKDHLDLPVLLCRRRALWRWAAGAFRQRPLRAVPDGAEAPLPSGWTMLWSIDRKTGKFRAMSGHFKNDGGGRANFSFSVAFVGATAAQSIYYLPKSDFSAVALASARSRCRFDAWLWHTADRCRPPR